MKAQKYFSADKVITAITWLIVSVLVLIATLIIYFLSILDDKAMLELNNRVEMAFNIEKKELFQLSIEYSTWDEAYEKSVLSKNAEWMASHYSDRLLPTYNLSFIAFVSSDKTVEILPKDGNQYDNVPAQSLLSSSVLEQLTLTQVERLSNQNNSFFTHFNDEVFLVSVEPYRNELTGNIVDGSHLVLAKALNPEYLGRLSQRYGLPHLTLDKSKPHNDSMVLTGGHNSNSVLGRIYWSTPLVTTQVLPYILVILLTLLVVTIVLVRLLLMKDHHNKMSYQEELFIAATTDPLTKISNRRHFLALAQREFQIQILKSSTMSLLLFDLDYFKTINDVYGHPIGDKALQHFTSLCGHCYRETDVFGRVGGEEFALLLPSVNKEKGGDIGNKIRQFVIDNPLNIDGVTVEISVSVGLATLTTQRTFDELFANADEALYLAKSSGRNNLKSFNE